MKIDFDAFEEYLTIDKYHLDGAVSNHAELLYRISEELAYANNSKDAAKKAVDDQYARTTLKLRELAAKNGVKTTEDQVKQSAQTDKDYEEAQYNYLANKLACDRLQALKDAFIARGFMIREMAGLWVAGYFADQPIKADEQTIDSTRYNMARQAIADKRQRRKIGLRNE